MADLDFGPSVARFDSAVDAWFDQVRGNPTVDKAFYLASAVGDHSLIWQIAGFARAVLPGGDPRDALALSVALGIESAAVNLGIKSLFSRSRPVHDGERPHGLRRPRTSSFPSGHASAAFFAAALLSEGRSAPERTVWYGLAAVVATSRVHVKIHHASDVAAGAVVGVVLGAVGVRAKRNLLGRLGVG